MSYSGLAKYAGMVAVSISLASRAPTTCGTWYCLTAATSTLSHTRHTYTVLGLP